MIIDNKSLIWYKLSDEAKELLFEFQHTLMSENKNTFRFKLEKLKQTEIKLIIRYLTLLGYVVDTVNTVDTYNPIEDLLISIE